jgi:hypothetical protein
MNKLIRAAQNSPDKVRVEHGKGDHYKFYAVVPLPDNLRNPMPCPYNLRGKGTICAIKKWLAAVGVIVLIVMGIIVNTH